MSCAGRGIFWSRFLSGISEGRANRLWRALKINPQGVSDAHFPPKKWGSQPRKMAAVSRGFFGLDLGAGKSEIRAHGLRHAPGISLGGFLGAHLRAQN
jgi:hypothetical protein